MKNNTILVVLALALFITSCNQVRTPSSEILTSSTEHTPTVKMPAPSATVAEAETQLMPTDSSENPLLYASMIEPGNLLEKTSDFCLVGEVPEFFWEGNENILHYAYAIRNRCDENGDQQISWGSYDLINHRISTTSPIYEYDSQLWSNLGIESPSAYPQVRGLVSPSGSLIIYPISPEYITWIQLPSATAGE